MSVSIALCTGVLLEGSLELLAEAGIAKIDRGTLGRRLLVEKDGVRVVLVRPADVAAYVDFGAVDLGVVGKDQLWENPGSHYELVDLGFGACTLVMAVPEESVLNGLEGWPPVLRIATKYPRATASFFAASGRRADIVGLHGSVELAPLVGLADAIVDLTATGATLRENRLRVVAEIGSSTARLIANQASLKTRSGEVQSLVTRLAKAARSR
ncbi:MAG: ATP phosphoribosyltransferase [Candidatus Dormibacteraeota bacterium]|nr:ATP phosphoribosyltransferase [Candidatus Dormibacteraeota bacterium]